MEIHRYLRKQWLDHLKVAWVSGDGLTVMMKERKLGSLKHLDIEGLELGVVSDKVLAANAYTGMGSIVTALEHGADIAVCGRCCDVSPVMGLAYWWHKWKISDYDELAGSLMAGHLIECGAYVTGENYCGFKEVEKLYRVSYPIAEIASDEISITTKPESTNGTVTIDTTKAQLLYEIQGPYYLNPDVIAHINSAKLEEIAKDRVVRNQRILRHVGYLI